MRSLVPSPNRPVRKVAIFAVSAVLFGASLTTFSWAQTKEAKKAQTPNSKQPAPAKAKPEATPEQGTTQPSDKISAQDLLKVTIASSRVSVTRDGSYGVYADLENISQDTVTIRSAETVLVVQPEVARPSACVEWEWGIFPARLTNKDGTQAGEMQIRPNEHYKVFWDLTARPTDRKDNVQTGHAQGTCSSRSQLAEYLGFVPGDYAFTVEGIAYVPGPDKELQAHTYKETTTLHVGISQLSTAIAAFIGAVLAFFVVALQPGRDFDKWRSEIPTSEHAVNLFVLLRNVFSAGLLGATVTIVASRLSDTQFPVKVSVNDFWGSLTIGFIAYFIGSRFILNLANRFAPPTPTGGKPVTSPGQGEPKPGSPSAQEAKAATEPDKKVERDGPVAEAI